MVVNDKDKDMSNDNSTSAAALAPEQDLLGRSEQALAEAGLEQSEVSVDPDARIVPPQAAQTAQPAQPALREVVIRVPADVSDERVQIALNMGRDAVELATRGFAILLFPTKSAQTTQPLLGRTVIPLMNCKDIDRLLQLAKAIGDANANAIKRLQAEPVAALAIRRDAERQKDNASRDLCAQAQGQAGGIIIP